MSRVVLVHGVPDTSRLWSALRAELGREDVVALDLPGFGVPLPAGFAAGADDYAAWIVERLARVGEPVDLVGHDWGSILAQRVAALRPDLVRTLACGSGPVDAEYVWHETAQLWQTPGIGEQLMEGFGGNRDDGGVGVARPTRLDAGRPSSGDCRLVGFGRDQCLGFPDEAQ